MTTSIGSVEAASDPTEQADWLELKALASDDGNSSLQDLVSELRRSGSTDALEDSQEALVDMRGELSEQTADAVFAELEDRSNAAGDGYPFSVDDQSIQIKPISNQADSTYMFMLVLSHFGLQTCNINKIYPARDFEEISQAAANGFFGHNEHDGSYLFASPTRRPSDFMSAVDELTKRIGEGGGAKYADGISDANQKDDGLDVVVWHGFKDD